MKPALVFDLNGTLLDLTALDPAFRALFGDALAMQQGLKLSNLSGIIHPYPTKAEALKQLGDASMKSRLKPWMKIALQKYLLQD